MKQSSLSVALANNREYLPQMSCQMADGYWTEVGLLPTAKQKA